MSAARTVLTLAAAAVVLPLAMRAREFGTARTTLAATTSVQDEGRQATPAELRAFLEAVRGANAVQCEIILQSFNSWSWNHAPDRDTTAWNVSQVIHRNLRSAESVPDMVSALRSGDACSSRVGARLLGQSRLPAARSELLSALGDTNPQVRQLGAIGLGFSDDSTTSAQLLRALADRDERVRAAAAWALGAIN